MEAEKALLDVRLPKYIRRRDAAHYLCVSLRTLDRLAAEGNIPFCKLEGVVVYDRQDLDAFISKRKVRPGRYRRGARLR